MRRLSTVLLIFKVLKIPIVVFQMTIIAKYFGVTLDRDIWLLSLSLVTVIDTTVWGPVVETFRAKFLFLKEELGESECLNSTSSFLFYMFIFSLLISILVYLFSSDFARLIAPNYESSKIQYLSKVIKLCVPFLVFNQITMVLTSILNSYNIFKTPEISSFLSIIFNILIIIFTSKYFGIYSLYFGQLFSLLVLLLFLSIELKKRKINLFAKTWKLQINGFATFFLFSLPFFLTYFSYNYNMYYEKKLVSYLIMGSVSILDYGSKIPIILNGIATSITLSIFLPTIRNAYVKNGEIEFNNQVKVYFTSGFFLIAIIINVFALNAAGFVRVLYYFSDFNKNTYDEIALISLLYFFYMFFFFTYLVFGTVLLSTANRKKYVIIGLLTQILIFVLYKILFPSLGIFTFPISNIISYLFSTILLYYNYPFKNELVKQSRKYLVVIFFSSISSFLIRHLFTVENLFVNVLLMTFITILLYIVLSIIFKIEETIFMINKFKNWGLWIKKN
jgi:putative peptidoglycan lipid II flippase